MQFPTVIDAKALAEIQQKDPHVRVIDVRTPAEWESSHISGSYNVPLATLSEHTQEIVQNVQDPVVLVCQSGARAQQAEQILRASKLEQIHLLDGGMLAWQAAQLPVIRNMHRWDIERQVRGVAGSIVLFSLLASFFRPAFKFVALFVGAGLTWSALSNTCMMATLLGKLPYNRSTQTCDLPTILNALKQPTR